MSAAKKIAIHHETAFDVYAAKSKIDAKIAALQKESKQLREQLESHFKWNQRELVSEDGGMKLTRSEISVTPTEIPAPYSYWKYKVLPV